MTLSHRASGESPQPDNGEIVVTLDRQEALWLKSSARRGAEDTVVPGARDSLFKLAKKIGRAIQEADDA